MEHFFIIKKKDKGSIDIEKSDDWQREYWIMTEECLTRYNPYKEEWIRNRELLTTVDSCFPLTYSADAYWQDPNDKNRFISTVIKPENFWGNTPSDDTPLRDNAHSEWRERPSLSFDIIRDNHPDWEQRNFEIIQEGFGWTLKDIDNSCPQDFFSYFLQYSH